MSAAGGDVTLLLAQLREGNPDAANRLMPLIYSELRRMAAVYLRHERPGHTLQATALVNEVYVRLAGGIRIPWQNRAHFFGITAHAKREVLLDYARRHLAGKRGGKDGHRTQSGIELRGVLPKIENVIAIDEALTRLEQIDPLQSRLVELRFFAGMSVDEVAEVMAMSPTTIKREWRSAKAWLHRELGSGRQS